MKILKKITQIFFQKTDYSPSFECLKWHQEQVLLGKIAGIDTSIYDYPELSPTLMECAREQLEIGSIPSSVKHLVDGYLNQEITNEEFEDLCEESVYIIDIEYLKDKFKVKSMPDEKVKVFDIPSAFYGACFGDIAGSYYEFGFKFSARKNLNFHNCIVAGSGPTDDTILSCATAKTLNEKIVIDEQAMPSFDEYIRSTRYPFISNPFTPIYREYAKMPFLHASYGDAFYSWVHSDNIYPYGSYGNGAAMRVSPIAEKFSVLDDVILYSIASAAATHNHMDGITGAVVVSVAIWMAKQGYSKQQIFNYMIKFYPEKRTKRYIYRGVALKEFTMDELKYATGPDICQYSVPAAAICFYYSESFEDVINNVLSFDGDTDTIGAIAGSIAGAHYGIPDYAKQVVDELKPKEIFDIALESLRK